MKSGGSSWCWSMCEDSRNVVNLLIMIWLKRIFRRIEVNDHQKHTPCTKHKNQNNQVSQSVSQSDGVKEVSESQKSVEDSRKSWQIIFTVWDNALLFILRIFKMMFSLLALYTFTSQHPFVTQKNYNIPSLKEVDKKWPPVVEVINITLFEWRWVPHLISSSCFCPLGNAATTWELSVLVSLKNDRCDKWPNAKMTNYNTSFPTYSWDDATYGFLQRIETIENKKTNWELISISRLICCAIC